MLFYIERKCWLLINRISGIRSNSPISRENQWKFWFPFISQHWTVSRLLMLINVQDSQWSALIRAQTRCPTLPISSKRWCWFKNGAMRGWSAFSLNSPPRIFNRIPQSTRIRSPIKPAHTGSASFDLLCVHRKIYTYGDHESRRNVIELKYFLWQSELFRDFCFQILYSLEKWIILKMKLYMNIFQV